MGNVIAFETNHKFTLGHDKPFTHLTLILIQSRSRHHRVECGGKDSPREQLLRAVDLP